jgi:hypothetical protein
MREQQAAAAGPRRSERRLRAGVTTADHNDIELIWELHCLK